MSRKGRESCKPQDIANELNVVVQEVTKACRAGVFPGAKQDGKRGPWLIPYPLDEACRLFLEWYEQRHATTDDFGTDWNLERAKQDARIKRATADMREQERDEMLGKFHRSEFVRDCLNDLVFALRASVMALPGKLAPALAGEADEARVAAIIKSECNALLESLSEYEYSEKRFRERLADAKGKEVEDGDS